MAANVIWEYGVTGILGEWKNLSGRIVSENPKSAKQTLLNSCNKNLILQGSGFAATDDLLIQFREDSFAIRKRDCAGNATCPAVIIELTKEDDGCSVTQRSTLASTGRSALLLATLLLVGLIVACIVSLPVAFHNPYSWIFGLSAAASLIYTWVRALTAKRAVEVSAKSFLQGVWRTEHHPVVTQGSKKASLPAVVSSSSQWHFEVPDMPQGGRSTEMILSCSSDEILQQLKRYAESLEVTLSQALGFGSTTHFDTKVRKDGLTIRRIRPTNSWLFRLLTHSIDLDFGPRLDVKVSAHQGCSSLSISIKTTLFRKLWTIFVWSCMYPIAIVGLFGPPLLTLGLLASDDSLALCGLALSMLSWGSLWTMIELRGADKMEYIELLSHLGEILSELPSAGSVSVQSIDVALKVEPGSAKSLY